MNDIQTWQQGFFVDNPNYRFWTQEEKQEADKQENLLVKPYPTGNAICKCNNPKDAKWIASRLNLASKLEQICYDVAVGRKDESDISEFVNNTLKEKI